MTWAGERRGPYRQYGQAFRRTHDAKDPGPSGCVAAGARGVAALDRIADTTFAVGTLSLPTLADRLPATQRRRFNLALTCSSYSGGEISTARTGRESTEAGPVGRVLTI